MDLLKYAYPQIVHVIFGCSVISSYWGTPMTTESPMLTQAVRTLATDWSSVTESMDCFDFKGKHMDTWYNMGPHS